MEIRAARRIERLPEYAFKVIDDKVEELKRSGASPVDFGVGDPSTPTPSSIREACKRAVDEHSTSGYPSYIGAAELREAIATWSKRRFGISLDPSSEISSTIGSKEGIFNFHEAFVDPGDVVLIPSPGYPPYSRGTWFAEGVAHFYPLLADNGFLPDLERIPDEFARAAKIMWINYPNSPTGAVAGLDALERIYRWTQERGIVLAVDEAYSEIYYSDNPPPSALQIGREGIVAFNSLSKSSSMTCYRVGWIAGDPRIVALFRKMKMNVDSGTPTFIQHAAIAALEDAHHMENMRTEYREKRDLLVEALHRAGLPRCCPEGTVFVWQKTPEGMTDLELATRLLASDLALVTIPGSLISEPTPNGKNPGSGYLRFSLTPPLEDVHEAVRRLSGVRLG